MSRYVVFSHGQESGPWGRKISALADVARGEGWEAESVDYRGIDHPRARITRLVDFCKELQGDLVLVGSSMGGFVSVASASLLHARGRILSTDQLKDSLYGFSEEIESNALSVHIHHLRRKLGADLIQTVRGLGYRFNMSGA